MANDATCVKCGRGPMVTGKVRKMPGAVVALGFLLLIASVLGFGIGAALKIGGKALVEHEGRTPAEIRQDLQAAGIPEPLVAKAMGEAEESVSTSDLNSLTEPQQREVLKAKFDIITKEIDPAQLESGATFMLWGSAIGLVLGWILRMKKPGLKCSNCGAAQAAA